MTHTSESKAVWHAAKKARLKAEKNGAFEHPADTSGGALTPYLCVSSPTYLVDYECAFCGALSGPWDPPVPCLPHCDELRTAHLRGGVAGLKKLREKIARRRGSPSDCVRVGVAFAASLAASTYIVHRRGAEQSVQTPSVTNPAPSVGTNKEAA